MMLPLVSFVVVACVGNLPEAPIERNQSRIAVKCILTPENTQNVVLRNVSGACVTDVDEAEVFLTDESGKNIFAGFTKKKNGLWEADFKPEYGRKYRLEVHIPGRELIHATTSMPDTLLVLFNELWKNDNSSVIVNGYTPLSNFLTGHLFYVFPNRDCNIWIKSDAGYHLASNHIYTDKFNQSALYSFCAEELYTEDSRYEKEYAFLNGSLLHEGPLRIKHRGGERINGVVANVSMGISSGNAKEREASIEIAKSAFNVYGDFAYPMPNDFHPKPDCSRGSLFFYIVSDELDAYCYDVEKYAARDASDILELLYSSTKDDIYTNIVGGVGVFGANLTYQLEFASYASRMNYNTLTGGTILYPYNEQGLSLEESFAYLEKYFGFGV